MNKIVTILVAAMLYLVPATYAQTSFTISPTTITGNQGETVTVSMIVNDFTDILSMQYGITWDAEVLEYVAVNDIQLSDLMPGNFNLNQAGDFLSLSWFDNTIQGITVADGTAIFAMEFVVLGDANSGSMISFADRSGLTLEVVIAKPNDETEDITNSVSFESAQFGDPEGNGASNNDGNTDPLISGISTASGNNGTTVCVDVSVGNFTDITTMDYSLVWDASILEYTEIRNINLAGLAQSSFNTSNSANGQLGVNWSNSAGATVADGSIYQACFNLLGNAGTSSNIAFGNAPTPISVTTTASTTDVGITQTTGLISVNNNTPPPPPSTGDNLVNISTITAEAGSEVCVPVTVNNFDEILSLQFSLEWDESVLQLTNLANLDALSLSESVFNQQQASNGRLAFAYSDPAAQGVSLADGTTIFEMCFTVIGASGTSSSIVFTDIPTTRTFADNTGEKDLTETNGAVNVSGGVVPPPPPPTPTGTDILNIGAIQGAAGSTVCIPMTVNDFDLITSAQFSLEWDPTVLEFTEIANINLDQLTAGNFNTQQAGNGNLALAWLDNTTQGITLADGTSIFELCFTVIGATGASTSISFIDTPTARLVSNATTNAEEEFEGANGSFTVGDGTVDPPPPPPTPTGTDILNIGAIQAPAGSTVCIPMTVNDFDLITSLQFSLSWDPAILQFTEIANINLDQLTAGNFNTEQASSGNLALAWLDNSTQGITLADGTSIFELCFTVVGATGGSTSINFTDTPTARLISNATTNMEEEFEGESGTFTVGEGTIDPPPPPPTGTALVNVSSLNAPAGSEVCVPMVVNDFDGVTSLQFSLAWDPNFLSFSEIQNINLDQLTAGNFNVDQTDNGQLALAWLDNTTQGITLVDGTSIFDVCFTVLGTAVGSSGTITFSDTPTPQVFSDATGESSFVGGNGTVTVGEGTVDPPPPTPTDTALVNVTSLNAEMGATVCVPIIVNDFDAVNSLQFSLDWDPSFLTYTEIKNITLDQLTEGNFNLGQVENGQLALAWLDNTTQGVTLADGTSIFEVCYTVTGSNGATSTISFTDSPTPQVFSNASGEFDFQGGSGVITVGGEPIDTTPVVILDKLVNIAPLTTEAGTAFCVPITVNDFEDLAAMQFSLGWNSSVLEFTSVQNFGIPDITLGGTFNIENAASGLISFAWSDGTAQGITLADGATLFEVCFNAVGTTGTSTTIAFTDVPTPREAATLNVEVPFSQTDGVISIGMVSECPGPITAIATPTNVSCNGESDGAISLEVSGGDGQYVYTWNDASIGNTPNPTGLAAGVYSVTITSCNGDQVKNDIPSASLTITEPPAILVVATPQNATCFGAADGRINVSLSGGTLPYTYEWSDATLAPANRPVNAAAGTYSLTVTDGSGCQTITNGISITSPSEITATVSTTPASCSGIGDGTATITPAGGSGGNYTFNWGVAGIEGGSPTNVSATDYMVTITDGNQCTVVVPVTVTATVVLSAAVQVIEDACGESKGAIQVTPTGGTAPYTYGWTGPVEIDNTNTAENIPTGNYTVTVTDVNGCFFVENIEVGGPTATLSSGSAIQNVDCPGDDSGSITLTATGGFSPYTYSWSNGATTATVSNLVEGDYTVTITDSKVCTYTETFTIAATSNMVVSVEVTKGAPDAAATVTVTGGVEPYMYEWCDGQTTATATGLDEGNCSLTVIDALGCTVVQNIEIQADNPVATIAIATPITCGGQADGALTVTVAGGNPAYTYAWSNGGTSSTISDLGAGTYEVTVADANGNLGTQSFDFEGPAAIVIDQTELTAVCKEVKGEVCISISGGTTPYKQIRWSNGVEDALCIEDLLPGEYGVIVTDQNDCTQEENFRIINDPSCTPCNKSNMVMTPNDDGRNDAFCISCVDIAANNHVEVYNRWGQLVFEADDYQCVLGTESDCWRGNTRSGNGVVEEGGYFWILEYDGPDGRVRIRDHFTILDEN